MTRPEGTLSGSWMETISPRSRVSKPQGERRAGGFGRGAPARGEAGSQCASATSTAGRISGRNSGTESPAQADCTRSRARRLPATDVEHRPAQDRRCDGEITARRGAAGRHPTICHAPPQGEPPEALLAVECSPDHRGRPRRLDGRVSRSSPRGRDHRPRLARSPTGAPPPDEADRRGTPTRLLVVRHHGHTTDRLTRGLGHRTRDQQLRLLHGGGRRASGGRRRAGGRHQLLRHRRLLPRERVPAGGGARLPA